MHIGLGDLPCDYTMEVRWPDGTTASFQPTELPEATYLTLTYPDTLTF